MKLQLLIVALTLCATAFSQKKEEFYDFQWKLSPVANATYYSTTEKTDSGWLRLDYYIRSKQLQMKALYEDEACKIRNGQMYFFHANGYPSIVGKMIHGKQEGVCVSYHTNGYMSDSAFFKNGKVVDKRFRWHRNGYAADSISRVNDSTYVNIGWFDDGSPAYAGYIVNDEQHGRWQYFHRNGGISAKETYAAGKLLKAEYFDETGSQLTDTSLVNRDAMMNGGQSAWSKYLNRSLYWPTSLEFTVPASVTVGISFWIDENGNVTDAEVIVPFHDIFDKIALSVIKKSPKWLPTIAHNRKVKVRRVQPIVFT